MIGGGELARLFPGLLPAGCFLGLRCFCRGRRRLGGGLRQLFIQVPDPGRVQRPVLFQLTDLALQSFKCGLAGQLFLDLLLDHQFPRLHQNLVLRLGFGQGLGQTVDVILGLNQPLVDLGAVVRTGGKSRQLLPQARQIRPGRFELAGGLRQRGCFVCQLPRHIQLPGGLLPELSGLFTDGLQEFPGRDEIRRGFFAKLPFLRQGGLQFRHPGRQSGRRRVLGPAGPARSQHHRQTCRHT